VASPDCESFCWNGGGIADKMSRLK